MSLMEPKDYTFHLENDLPKHLNELAFRVIGAAIDVHRELGPGYLESVYHSALMLELEMRGIKYQRECPCRIIYKGHELCTSYFDLVIENDESISTLHLAQTRSYLRAGKYQLALLINFNVEVLKSGIRRLIMSGAESRKA
jgi:GxxExxY protein